jgi:hypothetical protein
VTPPGPGVLAFRSQFLKKLFPGENVALFGEVDLENENRGNLQEVSVEEILELHQQVTARKDELERRKSRAMRERGLIPHQDVPDDLYF